MSWPHVKHVCWDLSTLLGKRPQLFEESVRDLLGRLKGSVGSRTNGRVDLGGPVDDVLDDGLGLMEHRSEALRSVS